MLDLQKEIRTEDTGDDEVPPFNWTRCKKHNTQTSGSSEGDSGVATAAVAGSAAAGGAAGC